ncbi:MAG: hypothetical protein ACREVK_01390 [Gammaproteobacteria bacterium]
MKNWQELSSTSHYQTAMAIRQAFQEGDIGDATIGIEELIEALSRSDKRALRSHLICLMMAHRQMEVPTGCTFIERVSQHPQCP